MREGDEWVPCYDSLRRGAKRGLPRAVRMVFIELCLEVRMGGVDGALRLPFGFKSDIDAVHDIVGGERREVAAALDLLSKNVDGDGPMIVLDGPPGARILTIPSFAESVTVASSRERMRKLRKKRREESQSLTDRGDVTPAQRVTEKASRDRVTCDAQRRGEERREDQRPPTPETNSVTLNVTAKRPGMAGQEVEAFLLGVADGVGDRPAPLSFLDRQHVERGLAKCSLPMTATCDEVLAWVRSSAARWSSLHLAAGKAGFQRGWHPSKWVEWLNAGCLDPCESGKHTAARANDRPAAPCHAEWDPDADPAKGVA